MTIVIILTIDYNNVVGWEGCCLENAYLPGTIRDRLQDLMKEHKVSQTDLALQLGVTDSTLSRFISGKTDKLGDESIIRIARIFNVSTDFLLGVTNIPDKKNYDISELGLSAQAARNLYTGKLNADVINRLLENSRFATLTIMIAQYFDDTLAGGYAVQNQIFSVLSTILMREAKTTSENADALVDVAKVVGTAKTPVYQADLTSIQNSFMTTIKEIKKEIGSDIAAQQALSKEVTEKIFAELTHGQDIQKLTISAEQLADAIAGSVSGMDGVNQAALNDFKQGLTSLFKSVQPVGGDGSDE